MLGSQIRRFSETVCEFLFFAWFLRLEIFRALDFPPKSALLIRKRSPTYAEIILCVISSIMYIYASMAQISVYD